MKKLTVIQSYLTYYIESPIQRVIELFAKYPDKEFSLSEIAKETRVKKSNIGLILNDLSNSYIIKINNLVNIWRISANRDNPNFIKIKLTYNLNFIYASGLIEFLIQNYSHPKVIVLFGSFRRGEDLSDSDIDIAVWNDNIKEYETTYLRELDKYQREINRKIQIHLFNDKVVDINIFNNIANGIVLYGFLEVRPNII